VTSSPENPHRKRKAFFLLSTRRPAESVEGLDSSLAVAAGDLWPKTGQPIAVVKGLTDYLSAFSNNLNCGFFRRVFFSVKLKD